MLVRKRCILAKIEAEEGTAETLTNADGGILVYEPKLVTPANWFERDFVRATLSRGPGVHGTRPLQLTFRTELRGSGTVGAAPDWGKYLQACGFDEDIVSSTSVTYHPISDAIPSLTMALYDDGVCFKGKGMRGNVRFTGTIGEPVMMEFDFQGVLESVTDEATPSPITFSSVVPVGMMGDNIFTIHGENPCYTTLDLDMTNTIALRQCANDAAGILSALITGRDPKGTVDPEMVLVSDHDLYGIWTSGAVGALSLSLTGAAGNIVTLTVPQAQYRELTDAERNGISVRTLGYQASMVTGDDEVEIVLT